MKAVPIASYYGIVLGAPEESALVKPVYAVFNEKVQGNAAVAMVEYVSLGMAICMR